MQLKFQPARSMWEQSNLAVKVYYFHDIGILAIYFLRIQTLRQIQFHGFTSTSFEKVA